MSGLFSLSKGAAPPRSKLFGMGLGLMVGPELRDNEEKEVWWKKFKVHGEPTTTRREREKRENLKEG